MHCKNPNEIRLHIIFVQRGVEERFRQLLRMIAPPPPGNEASRLECTGFAAAALARKKCYCTPCVFCSGGSNVGLHRQDRENPHLLNPNTRRSWHGPLSIHHFHLFSKILEFQAEFLMQLQQANQNTPNLFVTYNSF